MFHLSAEAILECCSETLALPRVNEHGHHATHLPVLRQRIKPIADSLLSAKYCTEDERIQILERLLQSQAPFVVLQALAQSGEYLEYSVLKIYKRWMSQSDRFRRLARSQFHVERNVFCEFLKKSTTPDEDWKQFLTLSWTFSASDRLCVEIYSNVVDSQLTLNQESSWHQLRVDLVESGLAPKHHLEYFIESAPSLLKVFQTPYEENDSSDEAFAVIETIQLFEAFEHKHPQTLKDPVEIALEGLVPKQILQILPIARSLSKITADTELIFKGAQDLSVLHAMQWITLDESALRALLSPKPTRNTRI